MPALVEDLWPVLFAFAKRRVRPEDAEDVAQEVLLKICSRVADFDPRRADGVGWAFTIASYELLTQRKREQRRREVAPALEAHVDPVPLAEEAMIEQELRLALAEAAAALTGAERAALGLEGAPQTTQDAAQRKRKQRALEKLRTIWRRLYGQP
jgi:RNA polymerase sigma factor (sigma-70 family)